MRESRVNIVGESGESRESGKRVKKLREKIEGES